MMFSTRAEYGVRVMVQLGQRHGEGPVPLAEIAQTETLPLAYLEHLVARLRKAELVRSTRGARGGYELSRPPAEITMADVVYALEGTLVPMQCFSEPSTGRVLCDREIAGYGGCATRLLWTRVQGGVAQALEQTTLAELVEFGAGEPARRGASKTRQRSRGATRTSATAGTSAVGT